MGGGGGHVEFYEKGAVKSFSHAEGVAEIVLG